MKKRALPFLLALVLLSCLLPVFASAETAKEPDPAEFYTIGDSENTFAGLYKRMCVSLDLKEHPLPKADTKGSTYKTGDYEYYYLLKDDESSYEYIGQVRSKKDKELYIIWKWIGYHSDGSVIGLDAYYTPKGQYLGNIQHDYTAGTSTSSHRCPYFIPGEPLNKD